MAIREISNKFMERDYPGCQACHIEFCDDGFEISPEELDERFTNSNVIVFENVDLRRDNDLISEICKTSQKMNPYCYFIIRSNKIIRPYKLNSIKNLKYVLNLGTIKEASNKNLDLKTIKWYNKANTKIVFENIREKEDVDWIKDFVFAMEIKPKNVYLTIGENNNLEKKIFLENFNIEVCK